MSTGLTKEVLPPRLAPRDLCAVIEQDRCLRVSIARSIWTALVLLGLLTVVMRCVEMWSW